MHSHLYVVIAVAGVADVTNSVSVTLGSQMPQQSFFYVGVEKAGSLLPALYWPRGVTARRRSPVNAGAAVG